MTESYIMIYSTKYKIIGGKYKKNFDYRRFKKEKYNKTGLSKKDYKSFYKCTCCGLVYTSQNGYYGICPCKLGIWPNVKIITL